MSKKKCSYCLRTLPADMFEQGSNTKGEYSRTECRTCTQEKRVKAKNQTPYTYLNLLYTQLKSSRRKSDIEWDIQLDYINKLWDKQEGKCALSGTKLTCEKVVGKYVKTNASIDRIIAGGEYNIENVQLVCRAVNSFRHDLTIKEFIQWCKRVAKNGIYKEKKTIQKRISTTKSS